MNRRAKRWLAAAVAGAVLAVPAVADASFVRSAGGTLAASSDTLTAPGSLALTGKYCGFLGIWQATATLSWTATPDSYASGYEISVTRAGDAPVVTSVSGRTTTAATVDIGNFANYTLTIRSVYRNWDSAQSTPVTVYCGIL